ncbi:hypothetical protein [Thermocrinis minervae]|uniref:Uncharacterized protein n=1 Tax=Thermocrinis minervae TaxID=381751 RepID=A0A1M6RKF9_9AQUI|nr:hypothetical protein [Thermocrinis minervae]SHK32943.1 hypothetical protein SAMN05444391_0687 [Thermocrinis minervae]
MHFLVGLLVGILYAEVLYLWTRLSSKTVHFGMPLRVVIFSILLYYMHTGLGWDGLTFSVGGFVCGLVLQTYLRSTVFNGLVKKC